MPDPEDPQTVDEAYKMAAKGLVKKSSEGDREVEYYGLDELREAAHEETAEEAAKKPRFGLRMTRLIPPGTG